jgi:RND family efflux transporter MFP subunit
MIREDMVLRLVEEFPMCSRLLTMLLWCPFLMLAVGPVTGAQDTPPLEVPVARPLAREVADHEDFTGRTEALATVELRARVSGYLVNVNFKDGAEVKRGEVLFEIDPRLFQAELEKSEAGRALGMARLTRVEAELKRAEILAAKGAMSQEEYRKLKADQAEATAEVRSATAGREVAMIHLNFTKVTAPISGRIGRRLLDVGNLVKEDATLLGTLVSQDPMYVYFDMDERTALRLRRMKVNDSKAISVSMGLVDEKGFPRQGTLDFTDNRLNPTTGTLRLRAAFANSDRLMLPGMFVRVRLTTNVPHKALLVPDRAVWSDKEKSFVFVVNSKNMVERRQVVLGSLHDNLREVREGVGAEDWVVVGRVQAAQKLSRTAQVRPRKTTLAEDAAPPARKE